MDLLEFEDLGNGFHNIVGGPKSVPDAGLFIDLNANGYSISCFVSDKILETPDLIFEYPGQEYTDTLLGHNLGFVNVIYNLSGQIVGILLDDPSDYSPH